MAAMQEGEIRCTNLNYREHRAAESYVWLDMFLGWTVFLLEHSSDLSEPVKEVQHSWEREAR